MGKEEPHALLLGMWIGTATGDNSMVFTQKIKNRNIIWPNTTTIDIYREKENTN